MSCAPGEAPFRSAGHAWGVQDMGTCEVARRSKCTVLSETLQRRGRCPTTDLPWARSCHKMTSGKNGHSLRSIKQHTGDWREARERREPNGRGVWARGQRAFAREASRSPASRGFTLLDDAHGFPSLEEPVTRASPAFQPATRPTLQQEYAPKYVPTYVPIYAPTSVPIWAHAEAGTYGSRADRSQTWLRGTNSGL